MTRPTARRADAGALHREAAPVLAADRRGVHRQPA
jgi:hypothetical protein